LQLHTDVSVTELYGHSCTLVALTAHAAHAWQFLPVPKNLDLHRQVMSLVPAAKSHDPNRSALGPHRGHATHTSRLRLSSPMNSPVHWHLKDPLTEVLESGHGEHSLGLSDAVNVPALQLVHAAAEVAPSPVWKVPSRHSTQSCARPDPATVPYVAAAHRVHPEAPTPVKYDPLPQEVQPAMADWASM